MLAVIDYNMGNVRSVANAFESIGCEVCITNQRSDLEKAERIVLPGVGAFGEGMDHLKELGLVEILKEQVFEKKKPFLGICLGMQLLADEGFEFGHHQGLGWIPGQVKKLEPGELVLPHVGWNNLKVVRPCSVLDRLQDADFYFVHSFHFAATDIDHVSATCDYGETFTAVVNRDHIYGAQFHPEKSQKAGKIMLENFVSLT